MNTDWINRTVERMDEDDRDRMVGSFLITVVIHLLLLFGIAILPAPRAALTQAIDVSLLSATWVAEPIDSQTEAQQNQQGSGNTTRAVAPRLSAGGLANDSFDGITGEGGKSLNPSVATFIAVSSGDGVSASDEGRMGAPVPVGMVRSDGGEAIDSLIEGALRKTRLGPSAHEGLAVEYRDRWKRWMTINGNASYPGEARRLKLRGTVLTKIIINSRGKVEEVVILESSGVPLLDAAVVQTTRGSKWFLPFPADLAAITDTLEFTYRWRYGAD